jgi:glycerol-3-phosphate O-acyltransferase/dihydroxyacetone phosphate acyltransferase
MDPSSGNTQGVNYDIFEAVDQSKMFDVVFARLAKGQCLGIFPEGGSHDNTDLLPLKVRYLL